MIKDILVFLDGSDQDDVRLGYAEQIAARNNAHITGLYINILPEVTTVSSAYLPDGEAIAAMQKEAVDQGAEVAAKLNEKLDRLAGPHELRHRDLMYSQARDAMADEAQTADIFIGTRPYNHANSEAIEGLMEAVLFNSGRGVLLTPPNGKPKDFDIVVLGWKPGRETARAVSEGMDFFTGADKTVVALVDENGAPERERREPGADIARYLARHGAKAELRHIGGWKDAGEALLNAVDNEGATLLVMGGYGHSRFRELVLGGATRQILSHAHVPVLIAH